MKRNRLRICLVVILMAGLILLSLSRVSNRSASAGQGKGGEIKPKPSASPTPRPPVKVAPKIARLSTPMPVKIAKVVEQRFAETINGVGVVSAYENVSVQAKVSGMLQKLSVQEGSAVKRGDVLAEIDNSVFKANEARARNALTQAQAEASSLPAGSRERIASEYRVRQRINEVNSAVIQLADCVVSSPMDGLVRIVRVDQGQTVSLGTPLIDITPTNQLRIQFDTSHFVARDIQVKQIAIRVGQYATVSDDQVAYHAQVDRVTTAPGDPKRITSVDIVLEKNGKLQVGDRLRVEIDMDPTTVVTVPMEAVVKSSRISKVLIVENGKAIERLVGTGAVGPDWIEIRSGVKLGQSVVVDPKDLRSGQSVVVVN